MHGLREEGFPLARIHEEDGPAALIHERIRNHHRRHLGGAPRRVPLINPPLARGHQAARFAEDRRAVGEALQGLEADPIRPLHHAHATAHSGLIGDLHAHVAGAMGPREQCRAAELGGHFGGEAPQLGVAAAPGIPAGCPGPDARALEALQRLFKARAQIVIQVPALQPRSQIQPQVFRVRQAVQLAEDQT